MGLVTRISFVELGSNRMNRAGNLESILETPTRAGALLPSRFTATMSGRMNPSRYKLRIRRLLFTQMYQPTSELLSVNAQLALSFERSIIARPSRSLPAV